MLRYVGLPLAFLFTFDLIVAVLYVFAGWKWIATPHVPLAILGGAIGAILAFRNSTSYARWWEARTIWGQIVNQSRSFARQVLSMITPELGASAPAVREIQRRILLLQIAYVHALRCHLRGLAPWDDLARLLTENEMTAFKDQQNVPVAIQRRIAAQLALCFENGWIDRHRWVALDSTLSDLMSAQGGAERIKNTPIPKQYDYFPQLFVRVYCLLLPLGMVTNLQLLTPIGSTVVGFVFLALDEIGRDLESPFDNREHDIPLNAITKTIEINLKQLLGETDVPQPEQPVRGVLW